MLGICYMIPGSLCKKLRRSETLTPVPCGREHALKLQRDSNPDF